MTLSRRTLLRAAPAALAAATLPRQAYAQAAPEKATVVVLLLSGGYNAVFGGADAYVPTGHFGATASNVLEVGNGLVVDRATLGALPAELHQRMATVGVFHGYTAHDAARLSFYNGVHSRPIALAGAITSGSPLTCVALGRKPSGVHPSRGGASLTLVSDVTVPLQLIAGQVGPDEPGRAQLISGVRVAREFSRKKVLQNPRTLVHLAEGYDSLGAALAQPLRPLDWPAVSAAYGIVGAATQVRTLQEQLAAAELMVDAGVDVVLIEHSAAPTCNPLGWDTHNDADASCNRALFQEYLLPHLGTFLTRTLNKPGRNVVTLVAGEFARTVPSAGHAGFSTPTVFGKYVRQGTTGRPVDLGRGQLGLPSGTTPGNEQLWSLIAALARAPTNPFGPNPHASLVL